MKKEYKKPVIIFENFSLSKSIASGCELLQKTPTDGECAVLIPDLNMTYIYDTNICNHEIAGSGTNNGLCYHVPTENSNVFSS